MIVNSKVIKAWDLKDNALLQNINIEFPSMAYGKISAFGPFPMEFFVHDDHSKDSD